MDRQEAISVLYDIIDSGIISEDLEIALQTIANNLCADSFSDCEEALHNHCSYCKHYVDI